MLLRCLSRHSQHAGSASPSPPMEHYQTKVVATSHSPAFAPSLSHSAAFPPSSSSAASVSSHGHSSSSVMARRRGKSRGNRPMLLVLGIRLRMDGVNPIYHETIKLLYTYLPSVRRHRGRASFIILFRRRTGRRPVLS
ncbi:hypothetical protein GGX14DRAFT_210199 [Mycena pura]|uniref:Uncharacterized protein n=1 Tax=Mycena pura TaxID=153505 RepID=A0AAD6UU87_9AGAR|nr:hypothetical protein GGX14DRAFT_210199 [Mycena pura]